MPLVLKNVEAARGALWVRDAFALFARRPLGFTLLFVVFLLVAGVVASVPLLGPLVFSGMPPLLSLGYMVASQSALLNGPVTPLAFIEPLRGDRQRRRSLLTLCALHAAGVVAIVALCVVISDFELLRLQAVVAQGNPPPEELAQLTNDPGISAAALTWAVLGTLLSVPFWYAPALVFWGAQGAGQALFSSTLAVWRNKGAFLVYGLTWLAVIVGASIVSGLVAGLLGAPHVAGLLALALALLFGTVFYVSLLFAFNDSFGGAQGRAEAV